MASRPEVSMLVPTCEGERTLAATLDSILRQADCEFEVVVSDDASTDSTLEIARDILLRELPADRVTIQAHGHRQGLAGNWNSALRSARGRWSKFVFQDDLLDPETVRDMVEAGDAHDVDLVVCRRRALYDDVDELRRKEYQRYLRWSSLDFVLGRSQRLSADDVFRLLGQFPTVNVIGEPVAQLLRTDAARSIVPYDARFLQSLDYEFAVRMATRRGLSYRDDVRATFRVHRGAATVKNLTEHGFMVHVAEPALLLSNWLHHPDLADVRARATPTVSLLDRRLDDALARVREHLRSAPADGFAWHRVLEREPDLERRWSALPADLRPPPTRRPAVTNRVRAWARLGLVTARRRVRTSR